MSFWTHFDEKGRPCMVDVGGKKTTRRRALAEGWIALPRTLCDVLEKSALKKGDPFTISELAGIMGAKRTSELIPLCHQVTLDSVSVSCCYHPEKESVQIQCEAIALGVTGVEMEALTGVSVAALVFYDMCKGIDKKIKIINIQLLEKSGGKSGDWFCKEAANENT